MSWKGNLRTGMAIAKRIERSEKRRVNNATRQYKSMLKAEAFENGQKAVQEYNDYLELISSTHKDTSEQIDWHNILNEPEPVIPKLEADKQNEAKLKLNKFKPTFFDKIFGTTKRKIRKLELLVTAAQKDDQREYENSFKKYTSDHDEWAMYQEFAKGVLSSDTEVYRKVIEYLDPFSDIKEIGSALNIKFEKEYLIVTLFSNGITVIPDFILVQTATGKVSKKKMPVGKFQELYQDYICSCALRVAREVFSFLPINHVFVDVQSEMLNTVNGHLEKQTILSAAIPALTLEKLNFETIDPSDSMKNFVHNMKFSKTSGFSAVTAISPSDIKL